MPILKFNQPRYKDASAGLMEIVRLYKGAPMTRGATIKDRKPGQNLDHFRVVVRPDIANSKQIQALFTEVYGERPTRFDRLRLLGNTPDEAFDPWMQIWNPITNVLERECDSETTRYELRNGIEHNHQPQPCIMASGGVCQCKPRGILKFVSPELTQAGYVGYIHLSIGSINEAATIVQTLRGFTESTGLAPFDIPWTLGRANRSITKPIKGERRRSDENLVYLQPDAEWLAWWQAQQAQQAMQLLDGSASYVLSSTVDASAHLLDDPERDWQTVKSVSFGEKKEDGTRYLQVTTVNGEVGFAPEDSEAYLAFGDVLEPLDRVMIIDRLIVDFE